MKSKKIIPQDKRLCPFILNPDSYISPGISQQDDGKVILVRLYIMFVDTVFSSLKNPHYNKPLHYYLWSESFFINFL